MTDQDELNMVSVHSTYQSHSDHHTHHVKKRRKWINDPQVLTRTSWVDANIARVQIKRVSQTRSNTILMVADVQGASLSLSSPLVFTPFNVYTMEKILDSG